MIARVVLSVVVAVVVGLLLVLLGHILDTITVPIAVTIGDFCIQWGFVLGVLAGIWYFFSRSASHPGSFI
jgi:hypothetical protein